MMYFVKYGRQAIHGKGLFPIFSVYYEGDYDYRLKCYEHDPCEGGGQFIYRWGQ